MTSRSLGSVDYPDSFWRSLHHLNRFRGFLALFFMLAPFYVKTTHLDQADPRWLVLVGLFYAVATWGLGRGLVARRPAFPTQLLLHVGTDVAFLTTLMALSGGNASGVGLLLIVAMAAAGMHPQPRMVFLMAAMGTLAVLTEQALQDLLWHGQNEGYLRAGLLAIGFFTVCGFSHVLAKGTLSSARLAGEKAAEAENLARINDWVIQQLDDGILVVDTRGEILQHNARALQLLSCSVFPHAGLDHCCPALAKLWRDWRTSGAHPDTPFVVGGDNRRLRARFMRLESTHKAETMILLEDVTELERQAQNMKLAALGRLTANLAHEIRNPLAAIEQAAALLEEEATTPTMARLARIIEDNSKRLNGLVEDVLSLNRRDRMQPERLPIEPFLREFIAQFAQAEGMPQEVVRLIAPADLYVRFDRLHLTQILWNLFRNAWRYCKRQPGSIEVTVIAMEATVLVDVFNDGEPISAEMQKRLFEPFYTTDSRGTGLGLYIARELAEANGGSLRYVDKAGGALFRLSCRPDREGSANSVSPDRPAARLMAPSEDGRPCGEGDLAAGVAQSMPRAAQTT